MRRGLALSTCAALAATAAACGGGEGALSGKSPAQILAAARQAALEASSMHYVLEASNGGQKQTVSGDAGSKDGYQQVVTGSAQVEVELIGQAAFLMGNSDGLKQTIGLPAAAAASYANRWISVASSDSLYQPITRSVTLDEVLAQLIPKGTLKASTPGTVAGKRVVGVAGGLPGQTSKGTTGTAVLYVSTDSPTVPVGFSATAKSGNQTVDDVGAFTHWGEALHLAPPAGAVPFASIPKS